jgi:hypothetical protein
VEESQDHSREEREVVEVPHAPSLATQEIEAGEHEPRPEDEGCDAQLRVDAHDGHLGVDLAHDGVAVDVGAHGHGHANHVRKEDCVQSPAVDAVVADEAFVRDAGHPSPDRVALREQIRHQDHGRAEAAEGLADAHGGGDALAVVLEVVRESDC